jgi:hypothetical protein
MQFILRTAAAAVVICLTACGGSVANENNFLRSYSEETYLWYSEIIDRDPVTGQPLAPICPERPEHVLGQRIDH